MTLLNWIYVCEQKFCAFLFFSSVERAMAFRNNAKRLEIMEREWDGKCEESHIKSRKNKLQIRAWLENVNKLFLSLLYAIHRSALIILSPTTEAKTEQRQAANDS